ncbi:GIY-YIG nuclease family protein [Hahella sp. SMD15-11]|uniref:GIY-YIG nuclease family protein n=1 Tax=Thermohahella caldifontis TaxID=3142973 RepID=A0AB39UZ00_9GAMM
MIVFTVRNKVTGQVYVGTTSLTIEERWSQFVHSIHTSLDYPLYNDIRQYGEDAFELHEWAVAETREEARDLEAEAIESENALSLRGYKTAATLRSQLKKADIDKAVERMLEELNSPSVFAEERPARTGSPSRQTHSGESVATRTAATGTSGEHTGFSRTVNRDPHGAGTLRLSTRTRPKVELPKKEPLQKRLSSSKEKRIREAIKAEKARIEAEKKARIQAEQDEMAAILARLDERSKSAAKLHRKR